MSKRIEIFRRAADAATPIGTRSSLTNVHYDRRS